jgi:hypothetical protein
MRVAFRENGQPKPISGTIACATCGQEFPLDTIVQAEHREKDTKLAITHPPNHKVSFATEGPDAISVFVLHASS